MVVAAAPTHVRAVRQFVLDPLTADHQQALARIAVKPRVRPVGLAWRPAKHGVIGLAKAATFEYGRQNLRINAQATLKWPY
ncbi:hypothetical protein [Actinomadura sp. HBU206391]|uniref:hypothetical protein n=1 Tax=Actinomadura sp. HBU206391 TaxID=2731692 RepID=UPI001C9C9C79|nr:hypothetical protein [Actinomadura sp. HBU206391]